MKPMEPMKPMKPMEPMKPMQETAPWWPENLGQPSDSQHGAVPLADLKVVRY